MRKLAISCLDIGQTLWLTNVPAASISLTNFATSWNANKCGPYLIPWRTQRAVAFSQKAIGNKKWGERRQQHRWKNIHRSKFAPIPINIGQDGLKLMIMRRRQRETRLMRQTMFVFLTN
jgi:hypothetical protein